MNEVDRHIIEGKGNASDYRHVPEHLKNFTPY
jgi:hypothetical protein